MHEKSGPYIFTSLSSIKIVSHTIFIYICLYTENLVYYTNSQENAQILHAVKKNATVHEGSKDASKNPIKTKKWRGVINTKVEGLPLVKISNQK